MQVNHNRSLETCTACGTKVLESQNTATSSHGLTVSHRACNLCLYGYGSTVLRAGLSAHEGLTQTDRNYSAGWGF
jgi:hypothetical protein